MTDLLDLGGVWLVEFLLSPEWGLPTVLLTLLLPALGQWLVLRCTRRRFRILRWLTLLPMGVPLLSSLWLAFGSLSLWPGPEVGFGFLVALVLSFGLGGIGLFCLFLAALYLGGWGLGWGLEAAFTRYAQRKLFASHSAEGGPRET